MINSKFSRSILFGICSLAIASSHQAFAAEEPSMGTKMKQSAKSATSAFKDDINDAAEELADATEVVQKMESEQNLKPLLQQARGIFIVPKYGQAGLGVGARGGEGVVLLKQAGAWSDPAFYNFGGINLGAQAGAEGGSLAFILNNDKAVRNFMKDHNFSLNADVGLTIVDYSAKGQAELSKADIVAWSDTKGLFGGATIGAQDIKFDKDEANAFYKKQVSLNDIYSGKVKASQPQVTALKNALAGSGEALSGGTTSESEKDKKK